MIHVFNKNFRNLDDALYYAISRFARYEAVEKAAADLLDVADSIAQRGLDKDRNLEQLTITSDALREALEAVKHE